MSENALILRAMDDLGSVREALAKLLRSHGNRCECCRCEDARGIDYSLMRANVTLESHSVPRVNRRRQGKRSESLVSKPRLRLARP